jgi:MFS family permease
MTTESPSEIQAFAVTPATESTGLSRYALVLLTVIYVFNNVDRQIVNILAEPIRKDLSLHDWQIGMMTGFSFAILYATLGIPIARLAERGSRPLIIATSIAVWSTFTALCGITRSFPQLILARIGVGVGEAGCTPAALSLISDTVPREKRASAMGLFSMGGPIGGLLGMAIGGLVADLGGWRAAFFVAAAPGLFVGALAALTLKDRRSAFKPVRQAIDPTPNLIDASRELLGCRTYVFVLLGGMLQALLGYGTLSFLGSFFFRNHGEMIARTAATLGLHSAGFLGLSLGLISGVGGTLGSYIGGNLADRHVKSNPRGLATQAALLNLIAAPLYIMAMLVGSVPLALVLLFFHSLCGGMTFAPFFTILQSVVRPRTRATAVALFLLMSNLFGLGLGPVLVGSLSDYLATGAGLGAAEGLRWALVTGALVGVLVALMYWQASKHIGRDMVS